MLLIMPKRNISFSNAPAAVIDLGKRLGGNIALARRRRNLRQEDLARKAGISRLTLMKVEQGGLGTGIGAYLAVLWALGLDRSVGSVAKPEDDREGTVLEAARAGKRVRVPRRLGDDF